MHLTRLELTDVRNYATLTLELGPGRTAILGDNGQGKSNLVEAVAFLATLKSFRGAPTEALVRQGAAAAVIRGTVDAAGRVVEIDVEIPRTGRVQAQVNRQRLARARDLLGVLRVTVFAPDDLEVVKGGPALRRDLLDDLVVALDPPRDAVRAELERVLRQRGSLLRQANGRLTDEVALTLDVWDRRLAEVGERWVAARLAALEALAPAVAAAYDDLAGRGSDVRLDYDAPWRDAGLASALRATRADDVRRQTTGVGPHRDDVRLWLGDRASRTHASQGEQRSLALAVRLGAHRLVTERIGTPPVLVLDDVFSELDPHRGRALLAHLPEGQVLVTTAGPLPAGARADRVLRVRDGVCTPEEAGRGG